MDREIVYPGQSLQETVLLDMAKNTMVSIGLLSNAITNGVTSINGLSVGPTSPAASMSIVVSPGEIYSLQNVDNTAYGSLAADTNHTITKQGILSDPLTLTLTAPATVGQSVVYLIQAIYQDIDTDLVTLPYYNSADPLGASLSGQGGNGISQPTSRKGRCTINLKQGVAATTGTQATPSTSVGYTALYTVTVAYGQTTITAANIKKIINQSIGLNNVFYARESYGANVNAAATIVGNNRRVYNQVTNVRGSAASLSAAGNINLPAGTYKCDGFLTAFETGVSACSILTVSGVTLCNITPIFVGGAASGDQRQISISCVFSVDSPQEIKIQQYGAVASATGFGKALINGSSNTFSHIVFEQIG